MTNDTTKSSLLSEILKSKIDPKLLLSILKDESPNLEKKLINSKLIENREASLLEFEQAIQDPSKNELNYWQPFIESNRWILGNSYALILDGRDIDLWNTADYIIESEDGFIDIVEIKHPHFEFWQKTSSGEYSKYRGFIQPSNELKGAITQAINYIFSIEKKYTDPDWLKKMKCETPVKPTCTIIIGRSVNWEIEEKIAFRLLNDSLHGISIITFDHLFNRALRLLKSLETEK